ncbi:hypothetical protein ASE01_13290 [Nocardioides sp. Root190]|nr:hypothetical protein ASE01_13290 [Nocardioides sp. Root190]
MTHLRVSRRVVPSVLLLAALVTGGCSPEEYVAPPPAERAEVADPAAAARTLTALQDALDDPDAAAALGADDASSSLLAAIAENATALRLSDVTFGYVTETGRTSDEDGWDGLVAMTWRFDGFDVASARAEIPVSFADGGRRIAGIGSDGGRLPLWLTGPAAVRRVPGAVVMATGGDVDRYAGWARTAVAQTRELLGGRAGLVVEIPDDTAALHRALDADRGSYDAIAAVTAPVDGSSAVGSPVHVFVNRAVYDDLDPVAGQVVMTHEAVHALTGATAARGVPLWLLEGFADHVALRGLDLPISRTAGQVIEKVRRDGLPKALPADTEFDPSTSHLGSVYEAAWQVTETLVERRGEQALVTFYRAVLDGTAWASALQRGFGWSEADLTTAWRRQLGVLVDMSE